MGFLSGKCCTYFSFLRACKIITHRFFCVHVARFLLLLCHMCTCTFVTGVCKLKCFIDFANISIRTSRFSSLFATKKTINITRPSKKTPKQSISYDFVAVYFSQNNFLVRYILNNPATNRWVPVLIENPALYNVFSGRRFKNGVHDWYMHFILTRDHMCNSCISHHMTFYQNETKVESQCENVAKTNHYQQVYKNLLHLWLIQTTNYFIYTLQLYIQDTCIKLNILICHETEMKQFFQWQPFISWHKYLNICWIMWEK